MREHMRLLSNSKPSSGVGRTFEAMRRAQQAQHVAAAFIRPRASSLSGSSAAATGLAASFVPDALETNPIAAGSEVLNSADSMTVTSARAAEAAHATTAVWHVVDLDLSAVIGQRGAAAVLLQALATTRRLHGWMPEPPADASFRRCVCALGDALADQPPQACAAGTLFLESTFQELLSSLVGAALTTELLRRAWALRHALVESLP
jgi:hypothetical protein